MNALRSVLAASRPISWVNTAFPYGAAYLVVGGAVDWLFWVGVLFFLVPYNIALYGINDVFDYESDIRNPRKGGVEGAVLAKDKHQLLLWSALLSTAPFLVVLYLAGTWHSALWLTLTMAAVLAYSAPKLRFKERPVLDSVTSAAHFVGPALVGSTIIGADLNMWFWWAMAASCSGAWPAMLSERCRMSGPTGKVGCIPLPPCWGHGPRCGWPPWLIWRLRSSCS